MCLYMLANPFIYSAFSAAWLIAPTSPRDGAKRPKACRSACSEVCKLVLACVLRVCIEQCQTPRAHTWLSIKEQFERAFVNSEGDLRSDIGQHLHISANKQVASNSSCPQSEPGFILTLSSNVVIWPVVALKTEKKRRKESLLLPPTGKKKKKRAAVMRTQKTQCLWYLVCIPGNVGWSLHENPVNFYAAIRPAIHFLCITA